MSASHGSSPILGVVVAPIATFVALFAHVAAGGDLPELIGVVAPLLFSLSVCHFVAARLVPAFSLALGVAACQAIFHALFGLGAGDPVSIAHSAAGSERAMHSTHAMNAVSQDGGAEHLSSLLLSTAGSGNHDSAMWVAHLIAGVVTVIALHHAEALALTLLAFASVVILRIVQAFAPVVVPSVRRLRYRLTTACLLPHSCGVDASTASRRGPPFLGASY